MRFLFKTFIAIPVLVILWGTANSLGITSTATTMLGLPDANTWQIPGLDKVLSAREGFTNAEQKARRKVRQEAIKVVRGEVERRYGPDVAALVPKDLTLREAKNFDFEALERVARAKGINTSPPRPPKTNKPKPTPVPAPVPGGKAVYAKALKTLDTLDVKGKGSMTGYDRDQFGSEWDDSVGTWDWSRNGIDTRNDVLSRDLVNVKCAPNTTSKTGSCKVLSGTLPYEPYTGTKNYRFDSEDDEYATDLDVEHVVALGNVWVTGGSQWTEAKRALIANDPLNLFAADPSSNRQKGDADFATWLPSNKSFRCDYAVIQVKVKSKYDLWVAPAEKDALARVLSTCA